MLFKNQHGQAVGQRDLDWVRQLDLQDFMVDRYLIQPLDLGRNPLGVSRGRAGDGATSFRQSDDNRVMREQITGREPGITRPTTNTDATL